MIDLKIKQCHFAGVVYIVELDFASFFKHHLKLSRYDLCNVCVQVN